MAKNFLSGGKKVVSVLVALTTAMLLMTGCDETKPKGPTGPSNKDVVIPPVGLPITTPIDGVLPPVPDGAPLAIGGLGTLNVMVRTDPADPHNERFLDDWRIRVFNIDDDALLASPIYWGHTGPDGNALIPVPPWMFALPIVVSAFNEALPLDPVVDLEDTFGDCRQFEIFIPPYCSDKALWLLGPLEDAVWTYYEQAALRSGWAWNPSSVDCGTWLAHLQLLILTDEVADELNELSDSEDMIFHQEALIHAFQENQHLLVPTRPPICMAERRHNGGGMERGETQTLEFELDDDSAPFTTIVMNDDDPIVIGTNGIVSSICEIPLTTPGGLVVNGATFTPDASYILDDEDFIGVISDDRDVVPTMDASIFNVKLGNGLELDHDKYDDACALTSIIEFTNKDDDEQDVLTGSGVTFTNLFGGGNNTSVYLTSDGDAVVDDNDYWAIFYTDGRSACTETVIAVELLGHRQEDFRDVLHMTFDDLGSEDLFLGLRADYELNEEEVDGERAFLAYTIHVWDGVSADGRAAVRNNIANCYEAADVWALEFFIPSEFDDIDDECCIDDDCNIEDVICPLRAAEFAVRSQCFSNSRANQRWRTDDSGYWSMNTEHGVHGNVIVNPGWLAPDLDFEIYIQKFDEAVFKGPRTIRRTDGCGQLMAELPTLVEGDRVLIKSEDNCCDDYDLVIPCVPEFTGFAGAPGIPYVPVTLGPPPVEPVPVQ